MKTHYYRICLLSASIGLTAGVFAQQGKSPNVILIMADDLGWGDVGFNGNTCIKTPFLDQMATEGTVFTNFYAGAPLSSPTRASVLTGRNAFRMGVFAPNIGILRPEEHTLPEYLHDLGYTTGHFGKWHLGTLTCTEVDANRGRPENSHLVNLPDEHGYDEAFVTESKVPTCDPMFAPIENNGRFWDCIPQGASRKLYGTYYWDAKGQKVQDNLNGDDSRVVMDRVLPFISRAVKKKQPFLATVWFHTPHLPCVAEPEYAKMYAGLSIEERNYYGCITAMDAQIRRLVDFLKQKGVYENTIIFFCSDNGPELNTPGTAGQYKGKKRSLYEGGIRVPSLMLWQAQQHKLPKTVSVPCCTSDYLPTVAQLIGFTLDKKRKLDGESFMPMLLGESEHRNTPLVFCSDTQGAVISDRYKLYVNKNTVELYDLELDPYEKMNLCNDHIEIADSLKNYLHIQMDEFQQSFSGKEYGIKSVERMKQKWHDIFAEKNN